MCLTFINTVIFGIYHYSMVACDTYQHGIFDIDH